MYASEFRQSFQQTELIYLTTSNKSIAYQETFSGPYLKRFLENRRGSFELIFDYNTVMTGARAGRMLTGIPRTYDLADDLADMIRTSPQLVRPAALAAALVSRRLIVRSIEASNAITGTTEPLLDRYHAPATRRCVIPNGVPSEFLRPISQADKIDVRKTPDEFLIGYVGVLREWVDFRPVLEAMKRHKATQPVRLMIIGEEGGRTRVESVAKELGVEAEISFVGTKPHSVICRYLAACNCGIIPFVRSRTTEVSLPLKLFEYASVGIPIVSTRIPAVEALFQNDVSLYDDSSELTMVLGRIIADPDEAEDKALICRERVSREYTWEKILVRLDEMIASFE